MKRGLVIGAGPAGLMAATVMAQAGMQVVVCDAKPSVGRKFLMAGKSGLNLTKAEERQAFHAAFTEAEPRLRPMLDAFGAEAVQTWAQSLGQEIFTGTTGRVFPKAMKASPLLRAWLAQLSELGAEFRTRWRWTGWHQDGCVFDTPDGSQTVHSDVTVLALGGASWARLGSDGLWADQLTADGVIVAPFAPANAGISVAWSAHMEQHLGAALKGIALKAGRYTSRGEAVMSRHGLEGGGIYSVSRGVREGADLTMDLLPDKSVKGLARRLSAPRGKMSMANVLRKTIKLDPVKRALLTEMVRPLPTDPMELSVLIKNLPIWHDGLRPMDQAISTAGGVSWDAVDEGLMLSAKPGVFVAGEMVDWEAPTGGYLITGCLATGAWAGKAAVAFEG